MSCSHASLDQEVSDVWFRSYRVVCGEMKNRFLQLPGACYAQLPQLFRELFHCLLQLCSVDLRTVQSVLHASSVLHQDPSLNHKDMMLLWPSLIATFLK